jgi:hypothetical protein
MTLLTSQLGFAKFAFLLLFITPLIQIDVFYAIMKAKNYIHLLTKNAFAINKGIYKSFSFIIFLNRAHLTQLVYDGP